MKILLFICLFSAFSFAQTIKTPDARRLEAVEIEIAKTQKQFDVADKKLRELLVIYTEDHPTVKSQKDVVAAITAKLTPLTVARTNLLLKSLKTELPNTQIELMKILIMQNERILDLLTDQAKPDK